MKSLLESADGSMATVATRRENNDVPRTAKIDLTPTGLLMEGDFTHNRGYERSWHQKITRFAKESGLVVGAIPERSQHGKE
jgi:hypothetical protein